MAERRNVRPKSEVEAIKCFSKSKFGSGSRRQITAKFKKLLNSNALITVYYSARTRRSLRPFPTILQIRAVLRARRVSQLRVARSRVQFNAAQRHRVRFRRFSVWLQRVDATIAMRNQSGCWSSLYRAYEGKSNFTKLPNKEILLNQNLTVKRSNIFKKFLY